MPMDLVKLVVETVLNHHPSVQAIYLFGSYGTEYERPESDADIALLLAPAESKSEASFAQSQVRVELERLLCRDVDLINLRQVSTVLQKEIVAADRRIYTCDERAVAEFEMLTLSLYQKLNEERAGIIENAVNGGRFHQV